MHSLLTFALCSLILAYFRILQLSKRIIKLESQIDYLTSKCGAALTDSEVRDFNIRRVAELVAANNLEQAKQLASQRLVAASDFVAAVEMSKNLPTILGEPKPSDRH